MTERYFGVLFIAHHVHEGAVVDAMHAQRTNEVAFHEPEGLGEQQRSGHFFGDTIYYFPPEFVRHVLVEFCLAHAVFGAGGNSSACSRSGKPEPMEMPLGECHGGVEADDRKQPRYIENGLNHLLANSGIQIIELRGIVPREAGAVVAVIDVTRVSGPLVSALEDHGCISLFESSDPQF